MSEQNVDFQNKVTGSITGFGRVELPNNNPNLARMGWSVEQLMDYVRNTYGLNFLTQEWIARIEAMISEHIGDLNNPHQTTLKQIIDDIIRQGIGAFAAGTVPTTAPVFAFDADAQLPIGEIFPGEFTSQNLYRRTNSGAFVDISEEDFTSGADALLMTSGLALFSPMDNILESDWFSDISARFNTLIAASEDTSTVYPFSFYEVSETPVNAEFGMNFLMNQNLQVEYTTTFLLKQGAVGGSVKLFRPSLPTNYVTVNLVTGECGVFADDMLAKTTVYPDGVIRVAVSLVSSSTVAENVLRMTHFNTNGTPGEIRQGSLGRLLFSVAAAQTTRASLNQPIMVDILETAQSPTLVCDLTTTDVPAEMANAIIAFTVQIEPHLPIAQIPDATIFTLGDLSIKRDQTNIFVTLDGSQIYSTPILEGVNKLALSYSPSELKFKDEENAKVVLALETSPLATTSITFGPMGGFLNNFVIYPQSDEEMVLEFLTNG